MTENKVFIAEQETLLEVKEQTEKLIRNLIPTDAPIYGMVIHEASDLNPATRVEYLGANKDFKPMSMNMATHAMDYGSWADWSWLKANVPVMCGWDGEIKYYLNPDDYTKKADGTASDASNANFAKDFAEFSTAVKALKMRGYDYNEVIDTLPKIESWLSIKAILERGA